MSAQTLEGSRRVISSYHNTFVMTSLSIIALALLYFVGFSHSETVHDAAHDVRHGASFPCH